MVVVGRVLTDLRDDKAFILGDASARIDCFSWMSAIPAKLEGMKFSVYLSSHLFALWGSNSLTST